MFVKLFYLHLLSLMVLTMLGCSSCLLQIQDYFFKIYRKINFYAIQFLRMYVVLKLLQEIIVPAI